MNFINFWNHSSKLKKMCFQFSTWKRYSYANFWVIKVRFVILMLAHGVLNSFFIRRTRWFLLIANVTSTNFSQSDTLNLNRIFFNLPNSARFKKVFRWFSLGSQNSQTAPVIEASRFTKIQFSKTMPYLMHSKFYIIE